MSCQPKSLFEDPRVEQLLGAGLSRGIQSAFEKMAIAEQEITRARGGKTEMDEDDPLWRSFRLLIPTVSLLDTEVVFRAHCVELLERVAAGEDTRPGTDAELVSTISRMSQSAPLRRAAVGLQLRLFERRFPEMHAKLELDPAEKYEQWAGEIDQLEAQMRRKLTDRERR